MTHDELDPVLSTWKTAVLAIILTGFVAVTYGFGVYLFATVVVEMKRDLSFGYATVGIITGAAQIGFLGFAFLGSLICPIIGGTVLALVSVVLCAACLFGLAFCTNAWEAGVLLAVLGGCSASVYVPLAEIVTRHVRYSSRARLLGLISSGTSYGVFANGLMVPYIITHAGWRDIWLVVALLTALLALISFLVFHRYHIMIEEQQTGNRSDASSSASLGWITRPVIVLWAITFINGLSLLPFQTYLVPIIRDEFHYSIVTAGQVWSSIGLIGMGAGFVVGVLADKIGIRKTLVLTFLFAGSAALLVWANNARWQLYVAAALFALAFYPIFGLVPAYMSKTMKGEHLTKAFGIANVMVGFGGMAGNFLGGLSGAYLGSFSPTYAAIAGLLGIQVVLTLGLRAEHDSTVLSRVTT
jgi:MFS family permease